MRRTAPWLAALVACGVYLANGRTIGSGDTVGPALVPVALLSRGTVDLAPFTPLLAPPGMVPYYLHTNARGTWSIYGIVPGVLVTPFYLQPYRRHAGGPWTTNDWLKAALRWQKRAAAVITALAVGVFGECLLALAAPWPAAAFLTAAFAFGTEAWAISAQALWQHGPATLALLAVLRAALAFRHRPSGAAALAGGVALGLVAAIRPFTLVLALPIAAWGFRRARVLGHQLLLAIPALTLAATWPVYNLFVGGHPLGLYRDAFGTPVPGALAGLLLSPARGLLPYCPAVLLAGWGAWAGRRSRERGLLAVLAAGAVAHIALLVVHTDWSAGHGFGPRYMAEVQPILLLLALPWVRTFRRDRARTWVAAALVAWGIGVQAVGACLYPAGGWDDDPVPVESAPERLWDWNDNPVFRELRVARTTGRRPPPALTSWAAAYRPPATVVLPPGGTGTIPVEVRNTGREPWPIHGGQEGYGIVHASWHLRSARGGMLLYEGRRARLGRVVGPGETVRVDLPVAAPAVPGLYVLEVTLVQEHVGWFEDRGVPPARVRLIVR